MHDPNYSTLPSTIAGQSTLSPQPCPSSSENSSSERSQTEPTSDWPLWDVYVTERLGIRYEVVKAPTWQAAMREMVRWFAYFKLDGGVLRVERSTHAEEWNGFWGKDS